MEINDIIDFEDFKKELKTVEDMGINRFENERFEKKHKARRNKFISENQSGWKETGAKFKEWREKHCWTQAEVARGIGISPKTLVKFEDGQPVMRANLIESAYQLLINLYELKSDLNLLSYDFGNENDVPKKYKQQLTELFRKANDVILDSMVN